jgi:hypothetical protein
VVVQTYVRTEGVAAVQNVVGAEEVEGLRDEESGCAVFGQAQGAYDLVGDVAHAAHHRDAVGPSGGEAHAAILIFGFLEE